MLIVAIAVAVVVTVVDFGDDWIVCGSAEPQDCVASEFVVGRRRERVVNVRQRGSEGGHVVVVAAVPVAAVALDGTVDVGLESHIITAVRPVILVSCRALS